MFTMETELAAIDHVTSIHEQGPRLVIKVRAVAVWRIPLSILPIRPYCVEMILIDRMVHGQLLLFFFHTLLYMKQMFVSHLFSN